MRQKLLIVPRNTNSGYIELPDLDTNRGRIPIVW